MNEAQTSAPAEARPAAGPKLTKRAVVDRALELADSRGLETLTIRKLATELNVTPMALYWHFRSKEELLGGLVERVWGEIDIDIDPAAAWPDQLRGLLRSLLAVLRAHPAATRLLMQFDKAAEASMRPTEVTLEVLRSAGFSTEHAAGIARFALWTGLMLVMSEPGNEWLAADEDERARHQRAKQIAYATLPEGKYPRVVECAIPLSTCDDPEIHYDLGMSIFIAGVEALARQLGGTGQTSQ